MNSFVLSQLESLTHLFKFTNFVRFKRRPGQRNSTLGKVSVLHAAGFDPWYPKLSSEAPPGVIPAYIVPKHCWG